MPWDRGEASRRQKRISAELGFGAFGFLFPAVSYGIAEILGFSEETKEAMNWIMGGGVLVLVIAYAFTVWARQQNIKRSRGG